MKTFLLLLVGFLATGQRVVKDKPLSVGEELQFKISYGWFTIGRGTFRVEDEFVNDKGRSCLKVSASGGTAGFAGVFSKVDDHFGATLDKETLLPYYSLRDLSEGNWDLEEHSYFDYDSMQIVVKSSSKKDKEERPDKIFELESDNVFDLMGGVMLARSLDYKAMQPGEEISLNAFFEDKFYDFNMIFSGREMISTKVGDIYCFKVQPVLPDNSIFKGEDAISFWVSADANRLPLKIEADMNFGKAFVELTAYKNVKSGIDFQ